jgi:hypothetical protein
VAPKQGDRLDCAANWGIELIEYAVEIHRERIDPVQFRAQHASTYTWMSVSSV